MRPIFFYIIVVLLFLLIPISGIGLLGTMVTYKYQVEESRIFLEMDSKKLSKEDIQNETKEIDNLEKRVNRQQVLMIVIAIISLIAGILLLKNKKRIVKKCVE